MAQLTKHKQKFFDLRALVDNGKIPTNLNATDNNEMADVIASIWLSSGYNPTHHINDCETIGDWTESDNGTFDAAADATNNKIGTNGLKLTNTASTNGTQNVSTTVIDTSADVLDRTLDWRQFDYIGFWHFAGGASHYGTAGEMLLNIKNDGSWGTGVNMPLSVQSVHQFQEVDITSFSRDKVEAIRFESNNSTTTENITIDDIKAYKFSNGRGPVRGACIPFPVKSSAVIVRGDLVELEPATMRIDKQAAVAVTNAGISVDTVTGNAGTGLYCWVQINGFCYLRVNAATVAGEGLIWNSNNGTHGLLVEGGATGADENNFARCLEVAGAQYDDILCRLTQMATFIS